MQHLIRLRVFIIVKLNSFEINIYPVGMRKIWVYAIALIMFLSIIIQLSNSTEAGPQAANVTVETEDSVEIDVSPGEEGRGVIDGTVECQTTNPLTPVMVSLYVVSSIGVATLDTPQIVFQGNYQSEDIRVSIRVPVSTTEASDEHTCTVTGTWQQGATNGEINPAVTQVIILPFSLCNITCKEPEKHVTKGASVSFTVNLKNEGNCDDEYIIDIPNIGELESKGFEVEDIGNVAVPIHESRDVEIKVHLSAPIE